MLSKVASDEDVIRIRIGSANSRGGKVIKSKKGNTKVDGGQPELSASSLGGVEDVSFP